MRSHIDVFLFVALVFVFPRVTLAEVHDFGIAAQEGYWMSDLRDAFRAIPGKGLFFGGEV